MQQLLPKVQKSRSIPQEYQLPFLTRGGAQLNSKKEEAECKSCKSNEDQLNNFFSKFALLNNRQGIVKYSNIKDFEGYGNLTIGMNLNEEFEKNILKYIIALMNSGNVTLIVGVNEKNLVEGFNYQSKQKFQKEVSTKIQKLDLKNQGILKNKMKISFPHVISKSSEEKFICKIEVQQTESILTLIKSNKLYSYMLKKNQIGKYGVRKIKKQSMFSQILKKQENNWKKGIYYKTNFIVNIHNDRIEESIEDLNNFFKIQKIRCNPITQKYNGVNLKFKRNLYELHLQNKDDIKKIEEYVLEKYTIPNLHHQIEGFFKNNTMINISIFNNDIVVSEDLFDQQLLRKEVEKRFGQHLSFKTEKVDGGQIKCIFPNHPFLGYALLYQLHMMPKCLEPERS